MRSVKKDKPVVVTTFLAKFACYLERLTPALFRGLSGLVRRYENAVPR